MTLKHSILSILILLHLLTGCRSSGKVGPISGNPWDGIKADFTEQEPFVAVDYGPIGITDSQIARNNIYVVFSEPVVPLARLGEPMSKSPVFSIDPPLRGTYRWYGTRYLSFTPEQSLPPHTNFTVRLNPRLLSLAGKKLQNPPTFTLAREPLALWEFFPGKPAMPLPPSEVPLQAARHMTLVFNTAVVPATIAKFIEVRANDRPLDFQAARPRISELKNLRHSPPFTARFRADYRLEEFQKHIVTLELAPSMKNPIGEQTEIVMNLAGGAVGRKGQAPLQKPIRQAYS
ncbi:MAG: Ig-like domain-containing protein, partial [Spirochaetota bacterium]